MLLSERKACGNKSGIYKITNIVSNTSYVGQATNIALRAYQHLHSSISEKASDYDYPLHRAIRKYGVDSFTLDVLEECPYEQLNDREMYWIAFYDTFKNGYNQTAGGYQSIRVIKLQESDVDQIRDRLRNTDDSFADIAEDFDICVNLVSKINNGRSWRKTDLSYPIRDGQAVQLKNLLNTGVGVYQLDKKTNEVLNVFLSTSQAATYLGDYLYNAHISKCITGKRKTAYGYKWETRPITDEQFKELVAKAALPENVKQYVVDI